LVTALRSLLRFLHVEGMVPGPLVGAVPAVAGWRLAALPRGLDYAEVAAVLAGPTRFDESHSTRKRPCCSRSIANASRRVSKHLTGLSRTTCSSSPVARRPTTPSLTPGPSDDLDQPTSAPLRQDGRAVPSLGPERCPQVAFVCSRHVISGLSAFLPLRRFRTRLRSQLLPCSRQGRLGDWPARLPCSFHPRQSSAVLGLFGVQLRTRAERGSRAGQGDHPDL
jgi:hypothetical protein